MQLISEWICIGIPKVGLRFTLFTVSLLISFKPYTCWTFQNLERCFQGSDAVPQILEGRHQGLVQAALGKKLQLQSFMGIGSSLKCWYEIYIYILEAVRLRVRWESAFLCFVFPSGNSRIDIWDGTHMRRDGVEFHGQVVQADFQRHKAASGSDDGIYCILACNDSRGQLETGSWWPPHKSSWGMK